MTLAAAVASGCLLAATAACSSDPALHVEVGGATVHTDDTEAVRVTDAEPGQPLTIAASATDYGGTTWRSRATYVADDDGTVDTGRDAPEEGDYEGVHATGPLFSLDSGDLDDWAFQTEDDGSMEVRYRVSQDGRRDGTASQVRTLLPPDVTYDVTDLDTDGIAGTLYEPADVPAHAPVVMVLGGSEGGRPGGNAAGLAMRGVPALALAYFGEKGLPEGLTRVPVEYFGKALTWLAARPELAGHPVVVMGASRGTEAAQLTALHYPTALAGVVLLSPTSFVNAGYPDPDTDPFTWQGRPVPHAGRTEGHRVVPHDPRADIDVAAIRVPMFLLCGTDDHLWPSCSSARRIVRESGDLPRTLVAEPDAGHFVDLPVPGLPLLSGTVGTYLDTLDVGGTQEADELGRLDAWPRLLAFLEGLGKP